ncbi:MAG: hypothetical protein KJ915_01595 [Candidatus Omnitrophica bacterium]|nr:hypothetical protein [Candidatus Omnitrophota bacterium]
MNEKKLEKALFIVLILSTIFVLVAATTNFIIGIFAPSLIQQISIQARCLSMGIFLAGLLSNVVLGIWLSSLAKKEGLRKRRWLWFFIGSLFGIIGVTFFFLFRMNIKIDNLTQKVSELANNKID